MVKIGIGADINAVQLKDDVKQYLEKLGYEVFDYGATKDACSMDYPSIAETVANKIKSKDVDKGLLFCGTGIGMAIAANKVKGIRAAQTHDIYSAERAALSNNAQIITMGAKVIGSELGKKIAEEFLKNNFSLDGTGKNSAKKIADIMDIEKKS